MLSVHSYTSNQLSDFKLTYIVDKASICVQGVTV